MDEIPPNEAESELGAETGLDDSAAKPTPTRSDVHRVEIDGRVFVLVGTAHISRESVRLVREVIETERPDCVCVELDAQRHEALSQERRFASKDLREIIRHKQLATLLINLMLASYQKRMGMALGVKPGAELLEAALTAEELGIPVALCDRDFRITLRRAWSSLSWWRKIRLVAEIIVSVFETPDISEEELARIREQDVLSELMKELGAAMPQLKTVLIDERDRYLAHKILDSHGDKVVAIVGAGHLAGMIEALNSGAALDEVELADIEVIPSVSPVWKWVGWGIPAVIVGSIVVIGWRQGPEAAGQNALYWFLANAIPSGIGGILALAHPATIVAGFFAAPFTSLTPLIGAGYVAAFVQTWFAPPTVEEFHAVGEDIATLSGWWRNRLLKVILAFLLVGWGSVVGTWVGGIEILQNVSK